MPAMLQVRGVTKRFGGAVALQDVSLEVERGEVVALVGDNGAGKSTLIKILSGILQPDSGEILLDGGRVVFRSPRAAADAGLQTVYQDLALCDNLDTVQNLFLGRELRGRWLAGRRLARAAMEKRTHELLAELNTKLPDISLPVARLSGGQRQSVAVCRSVLADPRLVLLDEPTAALGVAQRRQVLALISRLRDQGRGVVVISHDLADVRRAADSVVVLRLGRNVATFRRGEFTSTHLLGAITGVAEDAEDAEDPAAEVSFR